MSIPMITPNWHVPSTIRVAATTRLGGVSEGVYQGLNLGYHVGDDATCVATNRQRVMDQLGLARAQWLTQVHGVACVEADALGALQEADACWSDEADLACVIMTADCLPVVMTDGHRVAAAHAGWRGLVDGVLETTLACFTSPADQIQVWLGPAIGPLAFEVGEEVKTAFVERLPQSVECFVPSIHEGKWLADLYELARLRLHAQGVLHVSGGEYCTFSDAKQFYSYRRDGVTGRLATLIWRTAE